MNHNIDNENEIDRILDIPSSELGIYDELSEDNHRCTHDSTDVHTTVQMYTRQYRCTHDSTDVHTTVQMYTRQYRCTHDSTDVHTTVQMYTRQYRCTHDSTDVDDDLFIQQHFPSFIVPTKKSKPNKMSCLLHNHKA
ncbi:hypothetical protein J6590_042387 [Homalodisca vitripennis]|nr:hypothetical protein J6590_042387 [Homalodisca vitripennis]